eukprot:TRINITY_DN651_c0_g1_i2.p1 TRINITY_DN651_c0_g1~~TRINITY_DN651_c0_g1_i2.p1  ORF type:complete len:284 (-),score=68.09 TRINITY_DN651_c0_g1_i2:369-1220(-)
MISVIAQVWEVAAAAGKGDTTWQNRIYFSLGGLYALVALVALVQLVRIQRRVPEYGWTTQKVFHLLNFIVNALRSVGFFLWEAAQALQPEVLVSVVLDLPSLIFFTTYTLLVLFWAEIYHQARGLPTDNLRPSFVITNVALYIIQAGLWVYMWMSPDDASMIHTLSKVFFAGVFLAAAVGFLLYGGRLFMMLRRFPIESRGRRKKLYEVGFVTAICFTCFAIRAILVSYAFLNPTMDVDNLSNIVLNTIYYVLVELVPSSLVLFILRKLPPKRSAPVPPPTVR